MLQREIGWAEAEYGIIVTAFQTAYAAGRIMSSVIVAPLGRFSRSSTFSVLLPSRSRPVASLSLLHKP